MAQRAAKGALDLRVLTCLPRSPRADKPNSASVALRSNTGNTTWSNETTAIRFLDYVLEKLPTGSESDTGAEPECAA